MGLRLSCCRWYVEVAVHHSSLCCVWDVEGGRRKDRKRGEKGERDREEKGEKERDVEGGQRRSK